jgi:methanogenic corrinoid protein MtbC1
MGRRRQDDAMGGPPPDLASDAILDLARSTLDRMAVRLGDAPVSDAFVESFCEVLRTGNKIAAERMLKAATLRRAGYSTVADGLLSAAARRMGEMWQNDEVSFLEVSIAVSMIFRLNHEHAQRHVPVARQPGLRHAVFATLPGQAHNLGLVLAAEAFRQADWQVSLLLDTSMGMVLDRVRRLRPEAVGLSVSNLDRKHQLEHLIGDLQMLPLSFAILLGGSAADEVYQTLPRPRGVVVVHDIESALAAV